LAGDDEALADLVVPKDLADLVQAHLRVARIMVRKTVEAAPVSSVVPKVVLADLVVVADADLVALADPAVREVPVADGKSKPSSRKS
jgi:hypothetical protein